jgi:fatty-acyl-CoA synthase
MDNVLLDGSTLGMSLAQLAKGAPRSLASFPGCQEAITAIDADATATATAGSLREAGVLEGELVGVLVGSSPAFLTSLFGLWRAGAAVSVLPSPEPFVGVDTDRAAQRVARIVRAAEMRHLVVDDVHAEIAARLGELVPGLSVIRVDRLARAAQGSLPSVDPESLAVVQYTSGSTSTPKGVTLTHRMVMAGVRAIVISARLSQDDVLVQWLPTFHDMGLIGLLALWLNGCDVHVFTPTAFLRRPTQLLRYFSEHRGSVMTGPNFSYDYLLDAATPERLAAMDLSRWRLAFNGAEPVAPATVRRFTDALSGSGVNPSVMYPVYGMAEATLAISFPDPGSIPRIVDIQHSSLGADSAGIRVAGAGSTDVKQAVSVGRPVRGMEVRIADGGPTGGGNRLGEVQIRGEAVTGGYYRDARATRNLLADGGWLRTGDLGFWLGGELFVMGRSKEMITVHGRNFFPEDVESIVREVSGVYKKRCVAFPVAPGGCAERMGIIVEVDHGVAAVRDIQQEVTGRVATELSLSNVDVHLVEPRWLTKTTSGKWQRTIAAKKILAGVGGNR